MMPDQPTRSNQARFEPPRPSKEAVSKLEAIVRWYFDHYFGTVDGPGARPFYCDVARVGAFAVDPEALAKNAPAAVHRLAACLIMFQARKDQELMAAQRAMETDKVEAVCDPGMVLAVSRNARCPHLRDREALHGLCDVGTWERGKAECSWLFGEPCPVKDASSRLKRYGDFGKVPFSFAALPESLGAANMADLHRLATAQASSPLERAKWLEAAFCKVWRVDKKIAGFILSALSNPDLTPGIHPWRRGLDWRYFVVVDRHVMRALVELGAPEGGNNETYRAWLFALSRRTDLRKFATGVHAINPRLVQQALYRFRSSLNRLASPTDCCHRAPRACRRCPSPLRTICPLAPPKEERRRSQATRRSPK